jgi:hypothetical protein
MGAAALLGVMIMMMNVPLTPEDKAADRHAWAMLQRAKSSVEWHKDSLRRADLTGEGTNSRVMMGHDDDRQVWIGVVRPGREGPTNPHVFPAAQPLSLSFHKLESVADCAAGGDTPPDGCRPRKGMRGLTINAGEAPPQRLYWHSAQRLFVVWTPAP